MSALLMVVLVAVTGSDGGRFMVTGADLMAHAERGARGPSPGVAFLMSALVPGAAQVSQGRPWGWALVAADAAVWTGSVAWRAKADDLQREYREFAEAHYVLSNPAYSHDGERGWYEWWQFFRAIDPSFVWADSFYWADIRQAHQQRSDRYYRDIGTMDAYIFGWDDWAPNPVDNSSYWWQDAQGLHFAFTSPHRDRYRALMDQASSRRRWATQMVGVAVLLRAASAIEALRFARAERGLSVTVDWSGVDPVLVVGYRWPWP